MDLVVFEIDGRRYAVSLEVVERVVRAVEVTPLPGAPATVLGMIDVAGEIAPVFDLRRRLGLGARRVNPDDQFLLARTPARLVALAIDGACGVVTRDRADVIDAQSLLSEADPFHGIVRLADGLALIHDLERFLLPDEARALDEAIRHVHA